MSWENIPAFLKCGRAKMPPRSLALVAGSKSMQLVNIESMKKSEPKKGPRTGAKKTSKKKYYEPEKINCVFKDTYIVYK